jgi:hypothetical protein
MKRSAQATDLALAAGSVFLHQHMASAVMPAQLPEVDRELAPLMMLTAIVEAGLAAKLNHKEAVTVVLPPLTIGAAVAAVMVEAMEVTQQTVLV